MTSEGGTSWTFVGILGFIAVVALIARVFTPQAVFTRPQRRRRLLVQFFGLSLLAYWALREVRDLVGIDLARDLESLAFRSRVQLLLFAFAVLALAALAVWVPVSSLARTLLVRFGLGTGSAMGPLIGAVAATVAVAWASPTFLAFAARVVRL